MLASSLQSSMLLPALHGDSSQAYTQQLVWSFTHKIDWPRFQKAWLTVFKRHDTFYHRFEFADGTLPQIKKCKDPQVQIDRIIWSRFSIDNQKSKLKKFLQQDRARGFSLGKEPLCRLTLIRLQENCHKLVWTSQHSLLDGRGRLILIREFIEVYQSLLRREHIKLPPAPLFEDYLRWNQNQDWSQSLIFWKKELREIDDTTPLSIGLDTQPKKQAEKKGATTGRFFDSILTNRIHTWSQKKQISVNILIQAAWGLYLSRTSGKDKVVFAAPKTCRNSSVPNAHQTVGLLLNTVPIVVRINNSHTIGEYIQQVGETWTRIRTHGNTPLDLIKQVSPIPADKPLLSSLVGYEKYQLNEYIRENHAQSHHFKLVGFTGFPLALQFQDGKQIKAELGYDKTLFSLRTARGILTAMQTIVEQLIRDPRAKLSTVETVSRSERACIRKLSEGPRPTLSALPAHRIFEGIVKKCPNRTAVKCNGKSITYKELNSQANRLARFLKTKGVKPGTRVGLFLGKSEYIFNAQLAVLKAGGVYVPLDVEYPKERLLWMIQDATPAIILSTSDLNGEARRIGLKVTFLDKIKDQAKRLSSLNSKDAVSRESPAYIMYTSGSTGKPKGVCVPHSGITRLVLKPNFVRLSRNTRTLLLAPISFDASTFEIWAPLLNGGANVLFPERVPSPSALREIIKTESVNTLWLTASLFNFIIDEAPETLKGIEQLLVGGEALSPRHVRKAHRKIAQTRLINGYGPTENTTFSCCYAIPKNHPKDIPVPIGSPISHSSAYVLDKSMNVLPFGTPGELYVGGLGLSLGYLNEPRRTKERFVNHPFSSKKNNILYRTGDRAFLRPDGAIEYLGRFDDQVKIRGYRIEPAEIQSSLTRLNGVKDAVVLARKNTRGDLELAAFLALHPDANLKCIAIKRHLESKLPNYMVPSTVEFIDQIPRTKNGKVDRGALLSTKVPERLAKAHEPLDSTQKTVGKIWHNLLRTTSPGLDENFFQSGGHSLLAAKLIFEVQKTFDLSLTYKTLHDHPSIRRLSQWIDRHSPIEKPEKQIEPFEIKPIKIRKISSLSSNWGDFYFPDIVNPGNTQSHTISRAVLLKGPLQSNPLKKAIEFVVNLHERFRTHAIESEGKYYEKIERRVDIDIPEIDLSAFGYEKASREAMALFGQECTAHVNMRTPPLLRFKLIKLENETHLLTIVIHHSIADALSIQILHAQLSQAYNEFIEGKPISLKPSRHTFRQFERSLIDWGAKGNKRRLTDYWGRKVQGLKPIDYPFLIKNKQSKTTQWNTLDHSEFLPQWTGRIEAFTSSRSVSAYMFFTTVIKWLVARYTANLDSFVYSAVDRRSSEEEAGIVGDFASNIILRNSLEEDRTFLDQIACDRLALHEALDHKHFNACDTPYFDNDLSKKNETLSGLLQVTQNPETGEALDLKDLQAKLVRRQKLRGGNLLAFQICNPKNRLQVSIDYLSHRYVPHGFERLKYNFQQFIRLVIENPNITYRELPDLTPPSAYKKPLSPEERKESILVPLT